VYKLLIDNHCDVNVRNSNGDTALILSVSFGDSEGMKLLFGNHCDPNVSNSNVNTALILAALFAIPSV
jgi:ankyrin repeat protein